MLYYDTEGRMYLSRKLENTVKDYLHIFPAVAILGSRQCGKSTLARHIISQSENSVYLDLEDPSDLNKLQDPKLFFRQIRTL